MLELHADTQVEADLSTRFLAYFVASHALPGSGRVVSMWAEPRHAALARARLAQHVEVRVGPALVSLAALVEEPPFDLAFIDADTLSLPAYLGWAMRVVRAGSVIVVDNVL